MFSLLVTQVFLCVLSKEKLRLKYTVYLGKYVHVVMIFVGHFELSLDCRASHWLQVNTVHVRVWQREQTGVNVCVITSGHWIRFELQSTKGTIKSYLCITIVPFSPCDKFVLSTTKPSRDWFCSSPSSSSDDTSASSSDSSASSSRNWRPFRHMVRWERNDGKCQGWQMLKVSIQLNRYL